MTKEHREQKRHTKRSVVLYLAVLFSVAILFLLVAYLTQERPLAQAATQIVSLV